MAETKVSKAAANPLREERRKETIDYWGEIVTWQASNEPCSHRKLLDALSGADLPTNVAREFLPRNAFQRALRQLTENRIIEPLPDGETEDTIKFQFTKKSLEEDLGGDKKISYDFETFLLLDKKTGNVSCDVPELKRRAEEELERCMEVRTASDITAIVQRLFERSEDGKSTGELRLFPVRRQGGVYFVPEEHTEFADKIGRFLTALSGTFDRYLIAKGSPKTDASVRTAVADGLDDVIKEHFAAIEAFGDTTAPATMERLADKIKVTRHKIESYTTYLDDKKADLQKHLDAASKALKTRVDALMSTRDPKRKRAVID